jgi:membrane associated rhomboid family serine protease
MVIPLRDDNPTRTKPVVTLGLIIACVVIYFGVQPKESGKGEEFLYEYAAIPCEVVKGRPLTVPEVLETFRAGDATACSDQPLGPPLEPDKKVYLSMLFSMFFHGSILHLGGNMLFLWIFGNNVEDRLGKVGYLGFYLVTGFIAAAVHIVTELGSTIPVIGASGAIAGVMGAYLVFFPRATVLTIIPLFIFIQFVHLPAFVVLLGWFFLQFFTAPETGVAVMAHIGGFVAGAALALLIKPFLRLPVRRPPPPDVGFGGYGSPYR